MSANRQSASKLRRQLHDECARGDLQSVRDTLHALYEADDSPLGPDATDIANPAAFSALVEVSCLASTHAALAPDDPVRAHMAREMEENVERLRRGFRVDRGTMGRVRQALSDCEACASLDEAHGATRDALEGTQLHERVKVARHSVSYPPAERGARPRSPPPMRFDDDDDE